MYGLCGYKPSEYYALTPEEVRDVITAQRNNYREHVLDLDTISATSTYVNARIGGATGFEYKHGYSFKHEEEPAVLEDDSVNVFKQWVTVTGGKTI